MREVGEGAEPRGKEGERRGWNTMRTKDEQVCNTQITHTTIS